MQIPSENSIKAAYIENSTKLREWSVVEELVENRAELVVEFVEALQRLLCARWLCILR